MTEAFLRRWIQPVALAGFLGATLLVGSARAQDAAKLAMGDTLFNGNRLGACWACHGKQAKGTSTAPNLTDATWLNTDGTLDGIKGIITNGVPKPKKSKVPMPAMGGAKLTPEQIDAIAAYVVSMGKKK
jgi:mono/diheme cytochrome c family protein